MYGNNKRVTPSSGLFSAKPSSREGDLGASPDVHSMPDLSATQIPSADPASLNASRKLDRATLRENVLARKGTASAATFKPWYWSYNRDAAAARKPATAAKESVVTPFPAAAEATLPLPRPRSRALLLMAAAGLGALIGAGGFFALSQILSLSADTAPSPQTRNPLMPPAATAALAPSVPSSIAATPADIPPAKDMAATAPAPIIPNPAAASQPVANPANASQPVAKPPDSSAPSSPLPARFTSAAPIMPTSPPSSSSSAVAAPVEAPTAVASAQELDALIERGNQLLATGDIAAARLFYQRAAEQGSGAGATAVGKTYDPLFLEQAHVLGTRGDLVMAMQWYRKAISLGDHRAEARLKLLSGKPAG